MSQELDVMSQMANVDLSTVETSFPIMKGGIVQATITECTPEQDEGKPPYMKVGYTLAQEWTTQPLDGLPSKTINPGFPFSERIYVQPWTDPKTGEVKNFGVTRLTLLRECVFGKAQPGTVFNPQELIGQPITVKLEFEAAPKNSKTGEVYGPQTKVATYIRKAK